MPPTSLAEGPGHAVRGRAGGEAARLEHDELAALDPGLVEERERHPRGLAGPGRRDEHRVRARAQPRREIAEDGVDGERGVEGAHGRVMADRPARRKLRPAAGGGQRRFAMKTRW